MSDFTYHALSSASAFGGEPEAYYALHRWIDRSRANVTGFEHRLLSHHSQGISDCVEHFGPVILNSKGKAIPTQLLAEQHIIEDLGFVPSLSDWAVLVHVPRWASKPARMLHKKLFEVIDP